MARRWLSYALTWGALLFPGVAPAQENDVSPAETTIKAAFLYKFTGYVQWPKSSFGELSSPISIGVAGAEEISEELRRIVSGRTVQGRRLAVSSVSAESDLDNVHVLFIGHEAMAGIPRLLEAARQRPILVVTDAPDGLSRGSMINFVIAKRRVQFEIAVDAAEKAGPGLSSRLLSVALRVKKGDITHALYFAWQSMLRHSTRGVSYVGIRDFRPEKVGFVSLA